jgi:hypothetical protein
VELVLEGQASAESRPLAECRPLAKCRPLAERRSLAKCRPLAECLPLAECRPLDARIRRNDASSRGSDNSRRPIGSVSTATIDRGWLAEETVKNVINQHVVLLLKTVRRHSSSSRAFFGHR